ncbi:caspase domain-containing protein [Podospora didyma]|uniref:Caspase domain-containing protein n=1 Tax=Podospora didyma TaxID=330526 RepID=A0AAE0KKS5_9PEZI|nr:caspase domain-containing protein [Podospora didyma]
MEADAMPRTIGRRSAVLIGIDRYNSLFVEDLLGCSEDVRLVEDYLITLANISNITKLTAPAAPGPHGSSEDPPPTLKNVVSVLEKLAMDAQENDFIYIHYSGHGARLPTLFPSLKNGNLEDEVLVLVHESGQKVDSLRDVELAFLLNSITEKGAIVTIVLDCCHSAGAIRAGARSRGLNQIPPDALVARDPLHPESALQRSWKMQRRGSLRAASVMNHWMTASMGVEFLAACLSNQTAQEIQPENKTPRGLLTECLLDVLGGTSQHLDRGLTCEMVYNLVSRKVTAHKDSKRKQDVVFGGQRSRAFFGVGRISQAAVTITNITPQSNGEVYVELSAGYAHAVEKGDEFAFYPQDQTFTDITDYHSQLDVCKVTSVGDFVSQALVDVHGAADDTQGGSSLRFQVGCKAVQLQDILRRHVLSPRTVRVVVNDEGISSEEIQSIKNRIRTEGKAVELSDSSLPSSFFEVRVKRDNDFEISFIHNAETGIKETTRARSVDNLLLRLAHLAIYYNILSLPGSATARGLLVEKTGVLPAHFAPPPPQRCILDGSSPPPAVFGIEEIIPSEPQDITDGAALRVRVRNICYKPMNIEILDLEPSWKVSRIYPGDDQMPIVVHPNEAVDFFITMGIPAAVPDSVQSETFDSIIVLATTNEKTNFPIDILPHIHEISEGGSSPLDDNNSERPAKGVSSAQWYAERLNVRAVPRHSV